MRQQRVFILVLVGWYLILALGHYVNQRPLWHDEECVLNSIVYFNPAGLFTHPLLNAQDFPRLYLWAIQQLSTPFHQNLLALRLFSFMAMIGAFFVWLKIARRILGDSWDFVLFVGCWSAAMPLVYYAAELKPYSMDVLISGLIVLFLLGQHEIKNNRGIYQPILLLLPSLALWSYPAIFLLLLPLYNLIRNCFDERRWLTALSLYLVGCIWVLGFVYCFDFRVSYRGFLEESWHDFFISLHSLGDFFKTFGKGMNDLVSRRFAESPRWVRGPSCIFMASGVVYMLVAFGNQFKKDRFLLQSVVPITFAMFLLQLLLAVLRIFPFGVPRMSLFFTPLLFLMTIMALRFLGDRYKMMGFIFTIGFAGYLVFVSLGIAWDVFVKGDLGALSTLYSPPGR